MKKICSALLFLLSASASAQNKIHPNRALVISGGGAKGAWGVGVVENLSGKKAYYDLTVGTSTGTLIAPLALMGKFDELKNAYTHLVPHDVLKDPENLESLADAAFNNNFKLKTVSAVKRNFYKGFISNSDPLLDMIDHFFSDDDYDTLKLNYPEKNMYVASLNLRNGKLVYHDLQSSTRKKDFINWIWSSCNEPVYMSPYFERINDTTDIYVDGGIKDNVPLNKLIEVMLEQPSGRRPCNDTFLFNIDTIDVVIHNPKGVYNEDWRMSNTFSTLFRMIDILRADVRENDLKVDLQTALYGDKEYRDSLTENICIRKIFMPRDLLDKFQFELNFDSTLMQKAYASGLKWRDGSATIEYDVLSKNQINKQLNAIREYKNILRALSDTASPENIVDSAIARFDKINEDYPGLYYAREISELLNDMPRRVKPLIPFIYPTQQIVRENEDVKKVLHEIAEKYNEGIQTTTIDKLKK